MAFTTHRGRPRKEPVVTDFGTPELRLKHALRITAEPIDLYLEKDLITEKQHWCGLHLRWLYTLRYGAPSLTTRYDVQAPGTPAAEDVAWRSMREREYHEAARLLKVERRYECVMRLCVFNEQPAFLNGRLRERAWAEASLATQLARIHGELREGLDLLVTHWKKRPRPADA
jgi:hypothetical protein